MCELSNRSKRAIFLLYAAFIVAKIAVAGSLDLFGDEAFYWQCAQRPGLSYIDHPPLTALLIRAGTAILGHTPLGVRFFFLLSGVLFPFAVYHLTRPMNGERDAWLAAAATMVFPGTAHFGLIAIPDVPMLLATVLALLSFERATREESGRAWLCTGLCGAVGMLTHYRFILLPAAALLYLVLSPHGRGLLRKRGPWIAGLLLLLGCLPALVYNIRTGFEPTRYYVAGRHGLHFHFEALLKFIAEQVLVTTPLFLLALLCVLAVLLKRAWADDDRALLFSVTALTPILVFFLASPFEHSALVTMHWPVPGYVALLPFLPGLLRGFVRARPGWPRKLLAFLVPGMGGLLVLLALAELGGCLQIRSLREPFACWREVSEQVREKYMPLFLSGEQSRCILVADNYVLGANLEFFLHDRVDLFVLDHPRNRKHGRASQYRYWNMDEAGLCRRIGEDALVVVQLSRTGPGEREVWLQHMGSMFEDFELLGEHTIEKVMNPGEAKEYHSFQFYRGRSIKRLAPDKENPRALPL